ncbi:MAG: transketolase C-terminal domain-containing protein, partial [Acidobacteriota bacterium]
SVWVGEDGPTHQPVEHLMALRAIPGLVVLRPADANETAAAWRVAIDRREGPTALVLSRQGLPVIEKGDVSEGVARGARLVAGGERPDVVLLATGSEVALALDARSVLEDRGIAVRVVSIPSWELFAAQDQEYRDSVLPPTVPRLAIEAGITGFWHEWVGDRGGVVGIYRFGASAPGTEVAERLGLNVEAVVARALELL